jgi:septal ring factor EnvC (AmiA/AmiB activator)
MTCDLKSNEMKGRVNLEYKVVLPGQEPPVLTAAEREKYHIPLAYMHRRFADFSAVHANDAAMSDQVSELQATLKRLRKKVEHGQTQYTRLQASVSRLEKTVQDFGSLASETETAWNKLHDIERKLMDFPIYSSLKPADGL